MHIKLAKYKNFLGKGALPPCNPRQRAIPLDSPRMPCASARSAPLAHSCLNPLPNVENLPKPILGALSFNLAQGPGKAKSGTGNKQLTCYLPALPNPRLTNSPLNPL